MRLVILIALLLFPLCAVANEVVQAVGYILIMTGYFAPLGYAMVIGSAIYGADQARRQAALMREQQRNAYNAGLQDRTITQVATNAPHRYIYGQARVGSDIVAIFNYGARDEYHYLVAIHAAHECEAIDEYWVGGKALGTLDANGDVTTGDYFIQGTISVSNEAHSGTSWTLSHTPVPGSLRVIYTDPDYHLLPAAFTLSGADVTVTESSNYLCHYDYIENTPRVRVRKHLGGATDPADAELMSLFPDKWSSAAVLRGYCYSVFRLDLRQPEFQSGIPPLEALIRGAKLYDPRSGLTAYSTNNALAIYHYLTSDMCGVDPADIPQDDLITAANVCDETITIDGVSVTRYTCNGTVTADQDPQKVLESLAQSMAGGIVRTSWRMWAGKYVAPVMALDHNDVVGDWSTISGTPESDLYNGVRGQYIDPANSYVVTDFKPYQNAAYVTADGQELWQNIDYPFTDHLQRVHNLARIFCEDQRNGFTFKGIFSLKARALRVGQRVTFTSSFLGQTGKIYRVTDKRYGPAQGVELTLKEDAASIWDGADAVVVDATPNTGLPNPFTVGLVGDLQITEQLYTTTGSVGVRSKATLSWTAPADVTVIDYEVEYKPYTSGLWIELNNVRGTSYEFLDLAPGQYDFRVRARNILNVSGQYCDIKTFTIYGLTTAPAAVQNFSVSAMAGMGLASWDKTLDLDVKIGGKVVIRFCPLTTGASWEQSVIAEEFNGDAVNGVIPLATGTYYAKFIDSTGHYSDTAASFLVTEAIITGFTTVTTVTEHPAFAGAKTHTYAESGLLQLTGNTLWDDLGMLDSVGFIDTGGGVASSGTYNFTSTLDLGSVASRRFHVGVKAFSYDTGDTISQRGLVSTWQSIAGGVINDCDATVYARVSDDNITFGPWTPFMVADFKCRYAQFFAELSSKTQTHNIQLSELDVTVKIPA